MDCLSCKATIEDDSLYCDQCGSELLQCTVCGRHGAGKRCMHCGKPLAPIRTARARPDPATSATAAGRLRLSNTRHGIDIQPADGDVLGRRFGPHVAVLGRFSQISSNHLQVKRAADGTWRAIDLNSFNSTFYNGTRLTPQQEQPISAGGVLALGDIELRITIT